MLISSHLLGEMEQMVTQVGIIHHGKMLFEGALRDLKRHSRGDILLRVLDVPRALAALRQNGVAVCEEEGLLRLPPMEDERAGGAGLRAGRQRRGRRRGERTDQTAGGDLPEPDPKRRGGGVT